MVRENASQESIFSTMDEYPKSLPTAPLLGEDRGVYYRRLLKDSSRLFKDDEIDIEVMQTMEDDCS